MVGINVGMPCSTPNFNRSPDSTPRFGACFSLGIAILMLSVFCLGLPRSTKDVCTYVLHKYFFVFSVISTIFQHTSLYHSTSEVFWWNY